MDETKPEETKVPAPEPTPTQAPAPMAGQISSQMPKRTKARLVAQTAIIVILILGIAGALWYWFNVYQKPAPVVEQVKVEEPKEEPITLTTKYIGYSADNNGSLSSYDINPETGKLTEIFKTPGQYQQIAATTKDAVYYLKAGENGLGNHSEIVKYSLATKKEAIIAKTDLKSSYIVSGMVSPDQTRLAFAEVCQTKCSDNEGEKITTIKLLDLKDDSIKTIYSKKIYDNTLPFGVSNWENLNYVKLFDYCECDGPVNQNFVKILNVNTGNITEINLTEDRVTAISLSPDATKIAYAYFKGNYETKKFSSGFKVKNIQTGESETIAESTTEAYESAKWVSDTKLAVFRIKVSGIESGLGDFAYPTGQYAIALVNYGETDPSLNTVTDYAEIIAFGKLTEDYIFYTTVINANQTQPITNYALNLNTKKIVKLITPENRQLTY